MKKTLILLFLFSFVCALYSQAQKTPPCIVLLFNYNRQQNWGRAIITIKDCESSNPEVSSISKFQYYKGLTFEGIYKSDLAKFQHNKDSVLLLALDSYLSAFCIAVTICASEPSALVDDDLYAQQIISNLNLADYLDQPVMVGLLDSTISSAITLLSDSDTFDPDLKQSYLSVFNSIIVRYATIRRKD